MSTITVPLTEIAAQWRAARRIYPVYAIIVRTSDLGLEPCRDLESPIDRNDPGILARIERWFEDVDERSRPEHLRHALQTAHVAKEENLRGLLVRFLGKAKKSGADRDKIDFLLVQYFAQCAPHSMHNRELDLDDVSQVLEPVLGETVPHQPRWLDVLDDELKVLGECRSIAQLLEKRVLANVRRLKEEAGEMYFAPGALLAFTRFNFVARHAFLRLLHADLTAMRHALQVIEKQGVKTLDCTPAGLSKTETLETLHRLCHDWKKPLHAPYAAGAPFQQMMGVLAVLEKAVATTPPPKAEPAPAPAPPAAPPAPPLESAAKPAIKPGQAPQPAPSQPGLEASAHEVKFETPEGRIPTAIMEAAKQAACGPSTAEVPVYRAEQQAAPAAPPVEATDIQTCLEQLAEQLIGEVQAHPTAVATLRFGESKILLSSWEVAAFTKGGNDAADALQRAVSARTILLEAVERKKRGIAAPDLPAALKLAHSEVALLQEAIAQAKDAKNIDGAVNLAATCKRLLGLIDETEKQQGK